MSSAGAARCVGGYEPVPLRKGTTRWCGPPDVLKPDVATHDDGESASKGDAAMRRLAWFGDVAKEGAVEICVATVGHEDGWGRDR